MEQVTKNENGMEIVINDSLEYITKSPQITQLFAQAVAQVVTEVVAGTVKQVVVVIDSKIKETKLVLNEQKVLFNIAKFENTTKFYNNAYIDADKKGYSPEILEEYKAALFKSFKDDMQRILNN